MGTTLQPKSNDLISFVRLPEVQAFRVLGYSEKESLPGDRCLLIFDSVSLEEIQCVRKYLMLLSIDCKIRVVEKEGQNYTTLLLRNDHLRKFRQRNDYFLSVCNLQMLRVFLCNAASYPPRYDALVKARSTRAEMKALSYLSRYVSNGPTNDVMFQTSDFFVRNWCLCKLKA